MITIRERQEFERQWPAKWKALKAMNPTWTEDATKHACWVGCAMGLKLAQKVRGSNQCHSMNQTIKQSAEGG